MFQPQWNTPAGTIGSYASGATVNFQLVAVSTSGSFNMRYFLQSGSLAPGLTLDTFTGRITGTLGLYKTATSWTFTIRAQDGGGNLRDRTFSITAQQDVPPNFVTPAGALFTTPDTTWVYYQIPYTTSLSDSSVKITVISGSLPPGLTLGPTGILQGYCNPVTLTTLNSFQLKIENTIGSNTRNYTITVTPALPRLPTILNSQPLISAVPQTDPYYGYYRPPALTEFVGSIASTPGVGTIEGSVGATIGFGSGSYTMAGSSLTVTSTDGWILPGVTISAQLTGVPGGPGTYQLAQVDGQLLAIPVYYPPPNQNTSVTNIYAINDSSGSHTTFTGSVTGTVLTVNALLVGTVGIGQKLYTPGAIFVGDIISDGTNTATVVAVPGGPTIPMLPSGAIPWETKGTYTLDRAVTFTGPLTVTSNKLIVNQYNNGTMLSRGDGIVGGLLQPNTYIADQTSGAPGCLGVYTIDRYQYSPYDLLSIDKNILTVTSVTRGTVGINRVIQTPTGAGVLNNTVIIEQLTPLLAGETLGGIGRYAVSRGQTVASTTLLLDVDIGTFYYDDYFAYKIIGYDFGPGVINNYTFTSSTLPPGLTLNTTTGWITGIPTGIGTTRYNFTVTVTNSLAQTSSQVTFGVTFSSSYSNSITWITPASLGTITNYHISNYSVEAKTDNGIGQLKYRIVDGQLPASMQLLDNGLIIGRAAFVPTNYAVQANTTVPFTFTVQAYTINYPSIISASRTFTINVLIKYTQPIETIYLKCAPPLEDRAMLYGKPNSLFGGGQNEITRVISTDSTNNTLRCLSTAGISVGSIIQFSGTVFGGVSANTDYYVISIPTSTSIKVSRTSGGKEVSLTTAAGNMALTSVIISRELLYRPDDPYYGLNDQIRVDHIYGINANELTAYTNAVQQQHYRRSFTLGELKTAVARDSNNNIVYEVVYCEVVDNLINSSGVSVNYAVTWPFAIPVENTVFAYYSSLGDVYASWNYVNDRNYYANLVYTYRQVLYPNSLPNMRTNLINSLGAQLDTSLFPSWMTSQQPNGGTLGYVPAWVICYTQPGASAIVLNSIKKLWPFTMNLIDFSVDRILVDKSLTFNYNATSATWNALPSGVLKTATLTGTEAPNKIVVSGNTDGWHVDMAFRLSSNTGVAIGGLDVNTIYYIRQADYSVSPPLFRISKSLYGATEILVTAGLGVGQVITITPINQSPYPTDSDDYVILYNKNTILYP